MAFDLKTLMPNMLLGLGAASLADLDQCTEDDLYDYANEELDKLHGTLTLFVDGVDDIAVVSGQANYAYPVRRLATLLVALDGAMLAPANVAELEALADDWEALADTPQRYLEDYLGESIFRLSPTPVVDGTASMLYLDHPDSLSPTQTLVDVPAPIGDQLVFRAIAEARRQDTDSQMPEAVQVCEQLIALYDSALAAYWGGGL